MGGADVDFPPGEGGPPNNDANLSLIARLGCDGSVSGQMHDELVPGIGLHVAITCLDVEGTDAWISGYIVHVTPNSIFGDDFDGVPVRIRVRDNGTTANDPPDQSSFFFFTDSTDDCLLRIEDDLWDVNNGQVQIKEF
jgi:hypothetical protein